MWSLLCIPVSVGTAIMLAGGAPLGRWGIHVLAGLLGVAAHLIVVTPRRSLPTGSALGYAFAGIGLVASSLLGRGIDGVLRWHELGGLRIHPSALLVPAVLVLAAAQYTLRPLLVCGLLATVQLVHFLQPDAGQATAVAAGAVAIVLKGTRRARELGIALAFALSALPAWMRFDPLPPAAFVEDIVWRAFGLAPAVGMAAVLSLTLLLVAPYVGAERDPRSASVARARAALLTYFGGSLAAVCFGEFPVPLLGFGPSPLMGAFLGLAGLQRLIRACPLDATIEPVPSESASRSDEPTDAAQLQGEAGVVRAYARNHGARP